MTQRSPLAEPQDTQEGVATKEAAAAAKAAVAEAVVDTPEAELRWRLENREEF